MKDSQDANQPNPSDPKTFPSLQNKQDFFCFLKSKETLPKRPPPFFSKNGLSQDLIQVTGAEPDICLEVFYALYGVLWPQIERQSDVSFKDAWASFIGGAIFKGILCPPEKLIGKKKPTEIKKILSQGDGEKQIFQDLDRVISSISHLKQKIVDYHEELLQKEEILLSLELVEGFYQGYRDKVKRLGQALSKVSSIQEYEELQDALTDLLEPKAVMTSDIFPNHWAYRISRNKAKKILSLDDNERPIKNDSNGPSNHRVTALPEESEPLVYFKANGNPPIQPEKEFMLYSLYRQLGIPVPETALIIVTDVFDNNSEYFYAVQASEAVIGESALEACQSPETIFEQEAYVLQVIGALLTNPSDGKFANFKYSPIYKTLVGIDNDLVFKPEFIGENVNVKSILYLLPQMDLAIPKSIKTLFTTFDPRLMILSWLKTLFQKNQEYSLLFSRLTFQKTRCIYQNLLLQSEKPSLEICLQEKIFIDPDLHQTDIFSPQILVSENLLSSLSKKLQFIEKRFLRNDSISSQMLFEEISPVLGKYYRKLKLEFCDPEEALEALWGENKKGVDYSKIHSFLSHEEFNSFAHTKNVLDKNFPPEMFFSKYKSQLASETIPPLDKFIQRQGQRKRNNLLNFNQALEELRLLVQEGLTNSQTPQGIVDFWYTVSKMTEVDRHFEKEITSLLFNLPDGELRWLFTLEKYFKRGENHVPEELRQSSLLVAGAFMKQRIFVLTDSEKQALFDQEGNIKKNASLAGRSNVTCFPEKNPEFYFKQYPEFPGYESANIIFMRMIGITHLPYQDLLIVDSKYPVLLTQKVDGDPVFQIWQNPEAFSTLDPFHTYLLIISAMLLNPEDGKEDNFILSPDEKYLIPIDNDHCFLPSTFQKATFWNFFVNTALQTKTLLFCIDEMEKPIPLEVKEHVLSIDFDKLLQSWLQELVKVEDRYNNLVNQEQRNTFLENGTVLRIPLYEQFVHNLFWKVHKIQDLLQSTTEQTPFSLLKAVEPFAAKCYSQSFKNQKSLQNRFKLATKELYVEIKGSRTSILDTQSMLNLINISEKDLQNDATYNKMGPTDALELLEQLIQEQSQKGKLKQDLLCELDDKNEEGLWATLFGNPVLETALKDFFFNPKEGLVLKGSKLITSGNLTNLFAQTPGQGAKIKFLSLQTSPLLDSKAIRTLVEGCPNLEYLNMSGCVKLDGIITAKGEWPLLSRLEVKDCLNLRRIASHSPMKILRIGTHQKIEILVEKHTLDVFTISTHTDQFDFQLLKGDNFSIKPLEKGESVDVFLQNALLSRKCFNQYFRNPKITIGKHSFFSPKDLEDFITSLDLRNLHINHETFQSLIQLNLKNLKSLQLPQFQLQRTATRLFEDLIQGNWPKLTFLNLSNSDINDEGLANLSQGKWPLIERLDLQHTRVTKKGLLTFSLKSNWSNLKSISVSFSLPLTSDLQDTLLQRNPDSQRSLDLSFSHVTLREIETIVEKSKWPNLKKLNLSHNVIADEELKILSQGNWPLLESLKLEKIQITSVGIEAIVNLSKWLNLRKLNLAQNEITDEGLAILSHGNWPLLEMLSINHHKVTKKGLLKFALNIKWPKLRRIKLPDGSWLQKFPRVERLDLNNLDMTLFEIEFIVNQLRLQELKFLDLSNNQVSDEGISLLTLENFPSLEELNVQNTSITSKAIEMIVKQSNWQQQIKYLNLSNNEICDQGLLDLALGKWVFLEELHLRKIKITSQGIDTLVNKMELISLKKLNISENEIFDEGLKILSLGQWPQFHHLVYYDTQVTLKGNITLLENSQWPNLHHLENSLTESFYDFNEDPDKWSRPDIILAIIPVFSRAGPLLVMVLDTASHNSKEIYLSINHKGLQEKVMILPRYKLDQIEEIKPSLHPSLIQFIAWPPNLKILNLSNSLLSDEKRVENLFLTKCPLLEVLNLENAKITTKGIKILIKKSDWPFLKELCISQNGVFDKGLRLLLLGNWPLLESLDLRNTFITPEGIKDLISTARWPNLKTLDISDNMIFDRGLKTLSFGRWPLLESLNLRCIGITSHGIQSMIRVSQWPNLKILNISDNCLDDLDLESLSSGEWCFFGNLNLNIGAQQWNMRDIKIIKDDGLWDLLGA